jgi:hypothetical protein
MKANEKDTQPNVLSDVLLSEYVLNKEDHQRFHLNSGWSASESFDEYVVLYKIAIVLIALLNIEGKSQKLLEIRPLFERAVFTDGNVQKLSFYHQVKSTMDKLGEILDTSYVNLDNLRDQNEKLPWTMSCLRAAGVLESDQAIKHSRPAVIGMGWAMVC